LDFRTDEVRSELGFVATFVAVAGRRTAAFGLALMDLALGRAVDALAKVRFGAAGLREGAAFAGLRFAAADFGTATEPDFAVDLGALRAGAFSELERFTSGFGRADLPASVRFFADVEEY
jgi:hypothetical protein